MTAVLRAVPDRPALDSLRDSRVDPSEPPRRLWRRVSYPANPSLPGYVLFGAVLALSGIAVHLHSVAIWWTGAGCAGGMAWYLLGPHHVANAAPRHRLGAPAVLPAAGATRPHRPPVISRPIVRAWLSRRRR